MKQHQPYYIASPNPSALNVMRTRPAPRKRPLVRLAVTLAIVAGVGFILACL